MAYIRLELRDIWCDGARLVVGQLRHVPIGEASHWFDRCAHDVLSSVRLRRSLRLRLRLRSEVKVCHRLIDPELISIPDLVL